MFKKYYLSVKYKPGNKLLTADALSRRYSKDNPLDFEKEMSLQVCMIVENLPITLEKKEQFKLHTNTDEEIQILKKFIQ